MIARPIEALVERAGGERLPPELQEGLESVASLMAVVEGQAVAAELRAIDAKAGSAETSDRAAHLVASVDEAVEQELDRFRAIGEMIAASLKDGVEPSADAIASFLGVEGPSATRERMDEWMADSTGVLRLGPDQDSSVDHAERLQSVCRRADAPAVLPEHWSFERSAATTTLVNAPGIGLCVELEGQEGVLIGDGTIVMHDRRALRREPVVAPSVVPGIPTLGASRWASGSPPVLMQQGRAALASIYAAQGGEVPRKEGAWAAWVMLGAEISARATSYPRLIDVARLARDAAQATKNANAAAAALLRLSYELLRVTVHRTGELSTSAIEIQQPVIHVGSVRWCELSSQPVFWMPLFDLNPDQVGGGDRPWTLDIPAAGAQWQATPPALRLSSTWYAPLVVVPGDPTVCCVDPSGNWWTLDTDYRSVVEARRSHLHRFLDALEFMEEDVPARIAVLSASAKRPTSQSTKQLPSRSNDRFSKNWILERVERYEYQDDSESQAAGRAAAERGYYSREEFLTVVRWKSARSLPLAEDNPANHVENMTRAAFATDDELARMLALLSLKGVGAPVASALLHFAFPERYPILDYRALFSLGDERRRTQYRPEFWLDYLERCRGLAADAGVSIRELDKALWQESKESPNRTDGM